MRTARELILALYFKYDGDWDGIYGHILSKESIPDEDFVRAESIMRDSGKVYITIVDNDYPDKYKHDYFKPPFVIVEYEDDWSESDAA